MHGNKLFDKKKEYLDGPNVMEKEKYFMMKMQTLSIIQINNIK